MRAHALGRLVLLARGSSVFLRLLQSASLRLQRSPIQEGVRLTTFEDFNHGQVLQETESFFWTHFTDTYLELAKARARGEKKDAGAKRAEGPPRGQARNDHNLPPEVLQTAMREHQKFFSVKNPKTGRIELEIVADVSDLDASRGIQGIPGRVTSHVETLVSLELGESAQVCRPQARLMVP